MKTRIALCVGAVVALPATSWALGIRVPDQDARAAGRGNAFVATADNPSAIYYNPAGITQLEGMQARAGGYAIYIKDHYRSTAGVRYDTKDKLGAVPQLFSTVHIRGTPLTFGLGSYSPFGLALKWPENAPFTPLGKKGSLKFLTLNPVLAWKISDALSVAAGPTLNYAEAVLARNAPPLGEFRFTGDDFSFGGTAGVLWQPHERHAFGASYRSPTTMRFGGHSSLAGARADSGAELRFPQVVVAGYSFRPTPRWNLEFDVDWSDWDYLRTAVLRHSPPAPPLFPAAVPMDFNWQSSFMFQWGVTRTFDHGWAVSAGYIYSQNSVPTAAFNPTVPDSDRHVFSVGVGRTGKRVNWDVAYQFAYGPERTISNPGGPPALANGRYTFISHALALSFGYRF